MLSVNFLSEGLNCIFVWNVLYHQRSAFILTDTCCVYQEIVGIVIPLTVVVDRIACLVHSRIVAWVLIVCWGHWLVFLHRGLTPHAVFPGLRPLFFCAFLIIFRTHFLHIIPNASNSFCFNSFQNNIRCLSDYVRWAHFKPFAIVLRLLSFWGGPDSMRARELIWSGFGWSSWCLDERS